MCGIAGWVSHDPAHPVTRDVVAAMTDTMACRGPDAHGVWHDGHAAVGHRRLAVIDLDGGVQPMTAEHGGRTAAALTYSGEVFNYRELRAELAALGHAFRTDSDTEVVLRAFLEWGEDLTGRLNGMYAFAVWDPAARELLLVRDRLGVKPLYYHPLPRGILFGSEPKAILAHPSVRGVLDAEGMAELLAFTKTPGHAVYRGMHELRPGHTLTFTPTGTRVRRYWGLEAREHTDDLDTTVRTVRELLDDTIARQLVSDVPRCTLLSGGLDSSVITALAADHLRRTGAGPVRSFALDFTGQAENFRADGWRGSPDTPFAELLARHVGADHSVVELDTSSLMDHGHRAAVLRARDYPFDLGDGDTSLYLLFKAIREQSTVALSGESADELFGGYRWFHDADTVAAPAFPWLASPFAVGISGPASGRREALLDQGLLAKLDLPGYQAQRYGEALAEVPYLDGVTGHERRMREQCYLHLTRFLPWMLDRKDRASMAVGLEVRVPFCDHRLVQYVFNTPWSMKTFDGREKSLLRAAARDALPAPIADRVKAPYPTTQDPRYLEALRTELERVTSAPDAPVRPLLDASAVRTATARDAGPGFRTSTELVLQLDTWLRTYDVSLEL